VKILTDMPELTGIDRRLKLGTLLEKAAAPFGGYGDSAGPLFSFMADRLAYLLTERGFDVRSVRAVMHGSVDEVSPLEARRKLEALSQMTGSPALLGVAALLKRVKNISKGVATPPQMPNADGILTEPAEKALAAALTAGAPAIRAAVERGDYREAFANVASLQPAVAKFFDDVLVMVDDERLRAARLGLVASLRGLILDIADISEMVTD
jgi:glycyl-tRNA synthetase beta chain